MYNNRYPSNQPQNTQRNSYPAYGQTFQPVPQAQQTPAVLHAGLPTHGAAASQFNAFTPNYGSRFSGDLRAASYGTHISPHQSQIQQPTQQQHLSWQNKNNWNAADLSSSGSTNTQASHGGNMLTSSLYGAGGASGSNANSGLYGATQQQQQAQQTQHQQQRRLPQQTIRISGDDHTYQSHSAIAGGHNQQPSMASLSAFHTSPTPAPQQPHNTTHNNSILSLPTPNSSSSVASSLMRQQALYPMDTSNNIGLGNMSSIAGMGGSLGVSSFSRHTMTSNDATNLSHFAVVEDPVTDLDTDSLMDNQMVTTTLASNTPSTQTSISPNNQPNYVNSGINRYSQSQAQQQHQQTRQPQTRYYTPNSSPSTSINSITNSAAHSTVSPSVNGSVTPKRQSTDTNIYGTSSISGMAAQPRNATIYNNNLNNYMMSYSSQQATSSNVQQSQQQFQHQQQIQQQQLQQSQSHQTSRSPYQNYNNTSPNITAQQQQQSIHNRSSISQNKASPLITKPANQKTMVQPGVPAQQHSQSMQQQQHHSQQQQQPSSSQSSDPPQMQPSQNKSTPKQMVRTNMIAGGNTPSQQQQPSSFPQTNVAAQAKPSKNAPANTISTPVPKANTLPTQDVKNPDTSSGIPSTKDHKPKRPMNAFIIFSSERRPELQKNDPNMQTAQVSKILGEEWQNMDSTRKDHYNERARQLKEEFKQSNPDFVYTRRGTTAASKKRGSTSSATPSVKSPTDTIAVPPQATNVPITNGSVNGVTPHNSNNVYTSSPHQHTPTPSSTPIQQPRSTPAAATPQAQSTTQQPQLRTPQTIGTSSTTTPVLSARRDRKLRRPMNAFLIFNKEMRPKVLEMNPNMSVAEISKTIGENWRNMSEDERERYLQKARDLKSEFHESHPDFVYTRRSKAELIAAGHHSYSKKRTFPPNENSDSEEDPRSSHGNNNRDGSPATSPQKDPRGRKKKRSRHPTAPKHPMSGFLFYALEMRPHVAEQNPGSTVGPISKIIAGHWKNLTPEERAPWEKKASDDKARYAREMEQYLQSQKDEE
ncbi:12880_t:CDS:2 [Cetraspora pellucida]|uniref:12880_t:CDS:1 n=1 Tax=Cetraspora pellucida TaxID=1433469 RepID=A0A9N9IPV5_9GLOM|nr:12880_t:CDS:2 [Cetraspora pellucida]